MIMTKTTWHVNERATSSREGSMYWLCSVHCTMTLTSTHYGFLTPQTLYKPLPPPLKYPCPWKGYGFASGKGKGRCENTLVFLFLLFQCVCNLIHWTWCRSRLNHRSWSNLLLFGIMVYLLDYITNQGTHRLLKPATYLAHKSPFIFMQGTGIAWIDVLYNRINLQTNRRKGSSSWGSGWQHCHWLSLKSLIDPNIGFNDRACAGVCIVMLNQVDPM